MRGRARASLRPPRLLLRPRRRHVVEVIEGEPTIGSPNQLDGVVEADAFVAPHDLGEANRVHPMLPRPLGSGPRGEGVEKVDNSLHAGNLPHGKSERKRVKAHGPFPEGWPHAYLRVMDVYETRKRRLREFIEDRYEGNQAAFCRDFAEDPTYISRIFSGLKPFTELIARRMEARGLELGRPLSLDDDELAQEGPANGNVIYVPFYEGVRLGSGAGGHVVHEHVDGTHSYSRDWLLKQGLDAAMLSRVRNTGKSMEPTFWDGDTLLVNRAEKVIRDGKVYAFRVGDEPKVKRLFRTVDGLRIRVVSDNPDKGQFPDEYLSIDDMPEIIGRVRDRSGSTNL